jgi:hypothetical protein
MDCCVTDWMVSDRGQIVRLVSSYSVGALELSEE